MAIQHLKTVFIASLLAAGLSACAEPFEHTVFMDEHYGPWQSDLGREKILCYGRKTQVEQDCGPHMFVQSEFRKNPEATALTPDVLAQIEDYAAIAHQGTSASFKAGGLIYKLRFETPRPTAQKTCRNVSIRTRPSGTEIPWQDLSREVCF